MKIVFFGSDEFSIKALEACLHSKMDVVLVVTTPAKKKGRGLKLEPSQVFAYCTAKGIPVAEFQTLKDKKVMERLLGLRPDIFVAASYGKLIPAELLGIPKYRLNVHPSLLPKYRGSAPINWPILKGDDETGVSIIDIAEELDAGDLYHQEKLPISPRMNARELSAQLAALSYGVLKKVLDEVREGKLRGIPQDHAEVTFARQLEKKDGELALTMPAEEIDRKVRGLQPWPGGYFFVKGERVNLLETDLPGVITDQKAGTILAIENNGGMTVATGKGALKLIQVKPEGKKAMSAADFARGRRLETGSLLI